MEKCNVLDKIPTTRDKRLINFIIDSVLVVLTTILSTPYIMLIWVGIRRGYFYDYVCVFLFLYICYVSLSEYILSNTIGKYITNTRLVDKYGNHPKFREIFLRTLLRLLPWDPFTFLSNKYPIGWHDKFSQTRVINIK